MVKAVIFSYTKSRLERAGSWQLKDKPERNLRLSFSYDCFFRRITFQESGVK